MRNPSWRRRNSGHHLIHSLILSHDLAYTQGMPTLHKVTEATKTWAKWGAILITLLLVLTIVLRVGTLLKEQFFPTPVAPPTVAFGKLPAITFVKNATEKKLTYSINTLSGILPVLPDRVNVYAIQKGQPNFLNLKRAQERVTKVGFSPSGVALSDTLYQWSEKEQPFRKIILDIISSNFTISSNFFADPDIVKANNLPDEESAKTSVRNFLSTMSILPNDIDAAKTKTTFLTIKNQKLVPATSYSSASLIRVDLFQKDVDTLPLYYPHPPNSTMYFVLTGNGFEGKIVEAKFHHVESRNTSSTYPIKSANEALSELRTGQGYIASYGGSDTVSIKSVSLGYYREDSNQEYLMPIVVFEGNNGFFGYISAVTDEWVSK